MSERKRITTAIVEHDGKTFTVTFQPDGIHVREKFQRGERIIPNSELVSGNNLPKRANQRLKDGSIAESLDVAACDLHHLAELVAANLARKESVSEVKESLSKAAKIVRSLEVVTV